MNFRSDALQKVKLVMFEASTMPGSEKQIVGGKTVFVKNPLLPTVEMTKYTFRDAMGQKFEVMTKENGYRSLEGESVDVTVDIATDQFTGKTRVKLASVSKAQPQPQPQL